MSTVHQLSLQEVKFERAKAERANFIVSEVVGDLQFMTHALNGIEPCEHGIGMLWPEFLQWETLQLGQTDTIERTTGPGPKYQPRVAPRVRDIVSGLTPDDRVAFERCLSALCTNPYIDNITKFSVAYPPVILFLYQDGPIRIVYRITGGSIIDLLNVGWVTGIPSIADWDEWQRI
ncbi:MAG TPA: hypothetical protein VMW65_05950 [Chloroflexota bacterium]|nr:hypothetical protein [Chloroflexota bacterium]